MVSRQFGQAQTAEVVPVLLLAGTSGSGKSTLARALSTTVMPVRALTLPLDNYERLGADCRIEPDGYIDWEHPDSRNFDRLVADIGSLQSGQTTSIPTELTFRTTSPGDCLDIKYTDVAPPDLLIVEGHLLLHDPRVRRLGDLSIFLHTSSDAALQQMRRQHTLGDPYYDETYFKPGEKAHVLPTRDFADIQLDTGQLTIEAMTAAVLGNMMSAGLLPER